MSSSPQDITAEQGKIIVDDYSESESDLDISVNDAEPKPEYLCNDLDYIAQHVNIVNDTSGGIVSLSTAISLSKSPPVIDAELIVNNADTDVHGSASDSDFDSSGSSDGKADTDSDDDVMLCEDELDGNVDEPLTKNEIKIDSSVIASNQTVREQVTIPIEVLSDIKTVIEDAKQKSIESGTGTIMIPDRFQTIGRVTGVMPTDQLIVIKADYTHTPLNEGSVLICEVVDDKPFSFQILGKVFEVFGPITQPFYSVYVLGPVVQAKNNIRQNYKKKKSKIKKGNIQLQCDSTNDTVSENNQTGTVEVVSSITQGANELSDNGTADGAAISGECSEDISDINVTPLTTLDSDGLIVSNATEVHVGTMVYHLPQFSTFIAPRSILQGQSGRNKPSDASNLYDEEVYLLFDILIYI